MSITNPHLNALDEMRTERAEYIKVLTEAERIAFLTQLLSETDVPETPDSGHCPVAIIEDGIAPDEQSLEVEDARLLVRGIKLVGANHINNARWRSRCGCDAAGPCTTSKHGTSYIAVDYNHEVGRGAFDIIVYIRHYGRDYFGGKTWDYFVNSAAAYKLWRSGRLTGPGSPSREGYFSSGNNQTAGEHKGTLGVAAYQPGTNTIAWWGRWYFDGPGNGWGAEWLHCGKDYNIWFADN